MASHKLTPAQIDELRRTLHTKVCTLTPVKAEGSWRGRVHLGIDEGSYDTFPLCGALAGRATETTDEEANCGGCATVARAASMGYLLRDEDGWTGLYRPASR